MGRCVRTLNHSFTSSMDKLAAWDASKADNPQYMMSMDKKYVIIDTLVENKNECTFEKLFEKAEELHCDVLTAALNSLKRKKAVAYDSELPLLHPKDNKVVITLVKPDFDCFA